MTVSHGASWIYFKLYPGLFGSGFDHLVATDLAQIGARPEVGKWHFLRMTDDGGPHLRLRFLPASPEALQSLAVQLERQLSTLVSELAVTPESPFTPLVGTARGDGRAPGFSRALVQRDTYEPETGKYGTGEMLEACETHFQLSSEIAAAIIGAELLEGRSRKWMAPLLMARCVQLFDLPRSTHQFLADYSDYWMRGANAVQSQFDEKITEIRKTAFDPLDAGALLTDDETALLAKWEISVRAMSRAAAHHMPQNDNFRDQLAFNLCHLMMNRLGFPAADEAYLARLVSAFDGVAA